MEPRTSVARPSPQRSPAAAGLARAGRRSWAYPHNRQDPNPCHGPKRHQLLCPNLQMSPPADVWVERTNGRVLLHGQNSINSRGRVPLELRGHRSGKVTMRACRSSTRSTAA